MENVIGKTYGLLTVLSDFESTTRSRKVLVRCSCESGTEKAVFLSNLKRGNTESCGCLHKKAAKDSNSTHGLTKHPMYSTWLAMLKRTGNPVHEHYPNYGGRGITVCDRWKTFENFYADMHKTWQKGLTLDRLDNDKGYELQNCRWATRKDQNRNTRTNRNITLHGKTQCLAAWCEELGLNYKSVHSKLTAGASPEAIFGEFFT